MKLVLRILSTVFVLISSTAFADTTASDLLSRVLLFNGMAGMEVQLYDNPFEPQFEVDALGNTPPGWFDS